jgi:radical SAM superfamily enzyme YgiQ (UPF0313 family)
MATLPVTDRRLFWRNFDRRYHAAHPGLGHMRRNIWELPHWMTWLGGVLQDQGYTNFDVLEFYSSECALGGVNVDHVMASLRANPADVYLFSPMTPNLAFAYEIADLTKLLYPDVKIVFGGIVATPLREQVASHVSVDYVVHGRGEYALPDLLDALRGKKALTDVGNLCFARDNGEVVTTPTIYPRMAPADLPFPKVDMFPADAGQDVRYLRVVHGLGCPYTCSFCTIQTISQKSSYFPVKRVIDEIRAYRKRYGRHHNIYFGDELFTLNPARTIELCEALAREGDIGFDCQTRLNLLSDPDMLVAMKRGGCRWVEVGIEAFDQETQDLFKQRIRLGSIPDTLRRLQDSGLPACSFLVNGFPNQTPDDMRRSVDYVAELIQSGLLQASYLFGLVPYPGSDLYQNPEKYGIELHHHDYKLYHEDLPPVFSSPNATADEAFEALLYGQRVLSDAMSTAPYFGEIAPDREHEDYGGFWQDSHV